MAKAKRSAWDKCLSANKRSWHLTGIRTQPPRLDKKPIRPNSLFRRRSSYWMREASRMSYLAFKRSKDKQKTDVN